MVINIIMIKLIILITNNNKIPVTITCLIHGDFEQIPTDHTSHRNGCPVCKSSKGEKRIKTYLDTANIKYVRQYSLPGSRYKYDFYLPELNILIEYDGEQHFKPVKIFGGEKTFKRIKERDKEKDTLAYIHGIPLIRIKYDKFSKLEDYLEHEISKIYKYRVGNKWYRNFLELCRGESLSPNTKPKDVEKYLTYNGENNEQNKSMD